MLESGFESQKNNNLDLNISGEMTWMSVEKIMETKTDELNHFVSNLGTSLTSSQIQIIIDLSKVTKVDMCALALLIEIEKKIKTLSKKGISFKLTWLNVPHNLISLSSLCGLNKELGLN